MPIGRYEKHVGRLRKMEGIIGPVLMRILVPFIDELYCHLARGMDSTKITINNMKHRVIVDLQERGVGENRMASFCELYDEIMSDALKGKSEE